MDLNRSPQTIGFAVAEEVRALNHRSLDPKAFAQPGDVSDTALALNALVERLPQSLAQLATALRGMEERREIRMDDGTDPGERVSEVLRALLNAQEGLAVVRGALSAATGPLSHMGGHFTDDDEDDARHVD